jgi:predicted MFS family arabinose efflux permease
MVRPDGIPEGDMAASDSTVDQGSWPSIFLIYAIGVLGATTISQVIPVIGQLAGIFRAGPQIGWIISLPSALVAIGALLTGWIVDRVGDKRVLLAGSAIVVLGDIGAALAASLPMLLAMRVVEGVGYVGIGVAAITMMIRITQGRRRNLALALWSSFIPMSFALPFLVAGPLSQPGRWQWAFTGHAIVLGALLIAGLAHLPARGAAPVASRSAGLAAVVRSPGPYVLGLCFACAAFVQTGVVSTLPHLLSSRYGVSIAEASSIGTLGMLLNILGCLSVGPMLNRGVRPLSISIGGVCFTIGAGATLGLSLPGFGAAAALSCAFFFGAGVIVGLWALLPIVAPSRQSLGATSGLVTQLTLWGVLFGPPAAFAAEAGGQWLPEARNIVIASLAIVLCIWLVVHKLAHPASRQDAVGEQLPSAH